MTARSMVLGDRRKAFLGLSSDTKPIHDVPPGSSFFEADTKKHYLWTGAKEDGASSGWLHVPTDVWVFGDFVDTSNGVAVVEQGQFDYETVAASQSDQVLGTTGAAGDFLHKLIIVVDTVLTAATSIKDGSGSAISVLPNSPGGGIGVYEVEFNIRSTSGAWKVTTGAGASVIGIGRFTP